MFILLWPCVSWERIAYCGFLLLHFIVFSRGNVLFSYFFVTYVFYLLNTKSRSDLWHTFICIRNSLSFVLKKCLLEPFDLDQLIGCILGPMHILILLFSIILITYFASLFWGGALIIGLSVFFSIGSIAKTWGSDFVHLNVSPYHWLAVWLQ